MATLMLYNLHCNTTEDNTGADEAYIKVNGAKVWGPTSINDGETREVNYFKRGIEFDVMIELWDEDSPDPDDYLGQWRVTASDAGAGEKTAKFKGDDADYDLTYEVTK